MSEIPNNSAEHVPNPETSQANGEVVAGAFDRVAKEQVQQLVEKHQKWFENWLVGAIADFIPFAGPVQKAAQARAEFSRAQTEADKNIARERLVIATMELALDTATGGGSGLIPDEVLTLLNQLKLATKGEKIPILGRLIQLVDLPGHVARAILAIPGVQTGIDATLSVANTPKVQGVMDEVHQRIDEQSK